MKRTIIASMIAIAIVALALEGSAWGAAPCSSSPTITFNDTTHQATLQLPSPACSTGQPHCQWKFTLGDSGSSTNLGTVYGASGTLTIDYPKNYCGTMSAEAYVGPPWVAKAGSQHPVNSCCTNMPATATPPGPGKWSPTPTTPSPTPTPPANTPTVTKPPTTPPPATPTAPTNAPAATTPTAPTNAPAATTPTAPTNAPAATAPSPIPPVTPPKATTASLPSTAATAATPAVPGTVIATSVTPSSATPAVLPATAPAGGLAFTGLNVAGLVVAGLTLVVLGLFLLYRRRPGTE